MSAKVFMPHFGSEAVKCDGQELRNWLEQKDMLHFRGGQGCALLRDVCAWDKAVEGVCGTIPLSVSL